ncbi:hypothetical protein AAGG74_17150 [Bacillus mexicanus]|uniref:hypothetical protein n=1 Tax=Bacillus mexicanus TaxID=2834415 RepID=UPI003D214296
MKTTYQTKRSEIIKHLSSFSNIYKKTIEPIMFPSTTSKTYYSHLYDWICWGNGLHHNKEHMNLDEFINGSLLYFSKDTFTCNINPIILSELSTFSLDDKELFKEYMNYGFYVGYDLLMHRYNGFLKACNNCTLSLIDKEISRDTLLLFLKKHGVTTDCLDITTLFIHPNSYYKIVREYFNEIKANIELKLDKHRTDCLNYINEQFNSFRSQQVTLFKEINIHRPI